MSDRDMDAYYKKKLEEFIDELDNMNVVSTGGETEQLSSSEELMIFPKSIHFDHLGPVDISIINGSGSTTMGRKPALKLIYTGYFEILGPENNNTWNIQVFDIGFFGRGHKKMVSKDKAKYGDKISFEYLSDAFMTIKIEAQSNEDKNTKLTLMLRDLDGRRAV